MNTSNSDYRLIYLCVRFIGLEILPSLPSPLMNTSNSDCRLISTRNYYRVWSKHHYQIFLNIAFSGVRRGALHTICFLVFKKCRINIFLWLRKHETRSRLTRFSSWQISTECFNSYMYNIFCTLPARGVWSIWRARSARSCFRVERDYMY
jgi:hypothetical protein